MAVLTLEEWMDVKMLLRQGLSQRAVARRLGVSRNTVAKLAAEAVPQPYRKPPRTSKLDPYKPYLESRLQEYPLSGVRLLEEIRPMGYSGSIDVVCRFIRPLKGDQQRRAKATVRFETPPGHQAQIDWAHCGRFQDALGTPVAIYVFTMVLGFSRMLFVKFTTRMDLPTLLECHMEAFAFFGGWPKELLYDNMAQVRLPGGEWNRLYLDFAHHYGLTPRTCRVRRPRTKGKVERVIDYIKDNFLLGRTFCDLADLNAQGRHWLTHTANVRTHGTTRERPIELMAKEMLTPLSAAPAYRLRQICPRRVDAEGYVHLHRSRYSTAPEHVGKQVIVEEAGQRVIIRAGDLVLVEHQRAEKEGSCITLPEHVAAFWKLAVAGGPARPSVPPWQLTFEQEVAARPLSSYDEVAA
jgi:transposase